MNLGMNFECVLKDSPNQRFGITNTRSFEIEYNHVILVDVLFVHRIISSNFFTKSVTMYCSKLSPKIVTYLLFSLFSSYSSLFRRDA